MSDAVRAAQEKLIELRRTHGIETRGRNSNYELGIRNYELGIRNEEGSPPAPLLPFAPAPITNYELRLTNEEHPPNSSLVTRHSSLHSEPLTRHLRAAAERRARQQAADSREWLNEITNYELRITNEEGFPPAQTTNDQRPTTNTERPTTNAEHPPNSSLVTRHSSLVKVYPDIGLAMLRTKTAAAGRVWLLLRHADAGGRGRVAVDDAVRLLTGNGGSLRICGRKQLGNLLRAGDGRFWERDTDRDGVEWLRLHSAVRVAAGLGVSRLAGSPVAVPLDALTGTIGQVRAHLYATFHSGRTQTDLLTGERRGRGPIARTTLCKLSGATANSQRNYERRARVCRRASIAVGPLATAADEQETAWQRGRALFRYRDARGRYGRPGAVYLAWQLPNEYTGPHATLPRGRQKRLNRSLADLFHNGMTGNGGGGIRIYELGIRNEEARGCGQYPVDSGQWSVISGQSSVVRGLYFASAKAAHLARHDGERYWRHGGVWLWQPEIRNTRLEIRNKKEGRRQPAAPGATLDQENQF